MSDATSAVGAGTAVTRGPGKTVAFVSNFPDTLVSFRGPLLSAMVARGHRVHVCAPPMPPEVTRDLSALGVDARPVPFDRTGLNPLADLATYRALKRAFRELRADVVLTASSKPIIYGSLAARRAGVPAYYAVITGLGYAFAGTDRRTRLIGAVARRLYRLSLATNRRVFFQNPDNLALFRDLKLLRAPEQAVLVNGSGVNLERFAPAPLPREVSFLLIARLLREKGVREYVEAARLVRARHPEVRFRLVGWIDQNPAAIAESELRAWIGEGVIDYLGRLDDVRPAIAEAAVYVLPSYYPEGTPRTVLEAMAMGRPVITTDLPGCRQTVEDGRSGYLVPARDAGALAATMEKFIAQPELIAPMGEAGLAIARRKYDVHAVNAAIVTTMEL